MLELLLKFTQGVLGKTSSFLAAKDDKEEKG